MGISKYRVLAYPEEYTIYWYIGDEVYMGTWENVVADFARLKTGNCYLDSEEAEFEFEWRLLNTKILNSIALLNKEDNWVVDWKNGEQEKWYYAWSRKDSVLDVVCARWTQYGNNNEYFSYDAIQILRTLYTQEELKFWITKEK